MADAKRIAGEKADAEEDLAKAQPFLDGNFSPTIIHTYSTYIHNYLSF